MAEIDVLKAQVVRDSVSIPWGLTLQGSGTTDDPLRIYRVQSGSPVAKIGLKSGDVVTEIGDVSTEGMSSEQATAYINQHGDSLILTVERRASGGIPSNPVIQEQNPGPKFYQTYDMSGSGNPPSRRQRQRPNPPSHMQPPSVMAFIPDQKAPSQSYSPQTQPQPQFQPNQNFQILTVAPRPPSPPPERKFYQTYNLNGKPEQQAAGSSNFQTAVSRPFVEPPSRPYQPPAPQPAPQQPLPPLKPPPRQLQYEWAPQPHRHQPAVQYTPEEEKIYPDTKHSKSFKILSSLMANEEPYSGVQGLPPQRSATMERMKQEWVTQQQQQHDPKQRVKVLMPQQYNNPMSLYSAPNVVSTFAQQVSGLMNDIESQQQAENEATMSSVQEAVKADQFQP